MPKRALKYNDSKLHVIRLRAVRSKLVRRITLQEHVAFQVNRLFTTTKLQRPILLILIFVLICSCRKESSPTGNTGPVASRNTHALRFLGTNGYVDIPRPPMLQPVQFTVELWVYFDSAYSVYMPLLGTAVNERNGADGYSVKIESGYFYLRAAIDSANAAAYWVVYTPAVKQWIHLAGTFDGITARLFINGFEVAHWQSAGAVWYGTSELWLGVGYHSNFGGYSFFHGMLDEVRIWDRALDSTQIRNRMKTVVTEYEEGLVGYWNFDDTTQSDIAIDESKFSNHGLIWGDTYRVTTTPF